MFEIETESDDSGWVEIETDESDGLTGPATGRADANRIRIKNDGSRYRRR